MNCHCGRPLHYTNSAIQAHMEQLVEQLGPNVKVTVSGRTFIVPRHYIALHGIQGATIHTLGFAEIHQQQIKETSPK